jgi:hypothetical protein
MRGEGWMEKRIEGGDRANCLLALRVIGGVVERGFEFSKL